MEYSFTGADDEGLIDLVGRAVSEGGGVVGDFRRTYGPGDAIGFRGVSYNDLKACRYGGTIQEADDGTCIVKAGPKPIDSVPPPLSDEEAREIEAGVRETVAPLLEKIAAFRRA